MVMGVNRRRGPFSSANCRTIDAPDSVAASLWDARTFRTAKRLRHRTWNCSYTFPLSTHWHLGCFFRNYEALRPDAEETFVGTGPDTANSF